MDIKILKSKQSAVEKYNLNEITFGSVFTDHMFVCDYEDNVWKNAKIIPYQDIKVSPSSSVFHYGQAIFEGMKAFKDNNDSVWLFRPFENAKRFNQSCERLAIPNFPENTFVDAIKKLVEIEKNWILKGPGKSLYVRPFVIATEETVQASPSKNYKMMVICSPATKYYDIDLRVKIADKFSRAAKGGIGYAKAAGNYGGQFYPTQIAKNEGYQQIIWTDAASHKYIEEAGTMNLFFRVGNKLITPPVNDSILDGVTRKSIIDLCKKLHIKVEVRSIKVEEIINYHRKDELFEVFGSGTAVVIKPIRGFGYKGIDYELPVLKSTFGEQLKKKLVDIQYNISEDPFGWRHKVCD